VEIVVVSKSLNVDVSCALDVSGREHLVIVAKATWQIPLSGQRPRPMLPLPLEQADIFLGDPGNSAMLYGSDFCRFKPCCDVLFNAAAHSPNGEPVDKLVAGWQVGSLCKGVQVYGPRHWRKWLGITSLSQPEPFTRMPLHFGLAFGGSRSYPRGKGEQLQTLVEAQLFNPIGIGWYGTLSEDDIDGQPAPCLEELGEPVKNPRAKNAPAAFSAIARHWLPRRDYGGTYDDHWQQEVFPFLPDDFDERFNQCAPKDQQMPYPVGGEAVTFINMMAGRPDVRFKLPKLDNVKVRVLRKDYSYEEPEAVVDTLYFEPDEERFSVVWRASVPIRRRIQEFDTIAVGPVNASWWQQKLSGAEGCSSCGAQEAEIAAATDL
jgi:hypothetical protein